MKNKYKDEDENVNECKDKDGLSAPLRRESQVKRL